MYPDSGYKLAHAQSVCTRPFSPRWEGPGDEHIPCVCCSQSLSIVKELDDASTVDDLYLHIVPGCARAESIVSIGVVNKTQCLWALPNDSKRSEASLLAVLTDTVYL